MPGFLSLSLASIVILRHCAARPVVNPRHGLTRDTSCCQESRLCGSAATSAGTGARPRTSSRDSRRCKTLPRARSLVTLESRIFARHENREESFWSFVRAHHFDEDATSSTGDQVGPASYTTRNHSGGPYPLVI